MSQTFVIERLPDEQYQFVIDAVGAGSTDRQICADFEKNFGAPPLRVRRNLLILTRSRDKL
jgi:hypothetical protein